MEGIYDLQGDLVLKKQRLVGAGPAALILWIIQAESVPRIKWLGRILEEGDKACNMLRNVLVAQMKSGEVCSFAETFYDSQTGQFMMLGQKQSSELQLCKRREIILCDFNNFLKSLNLATYPTLKLTLEALARPLKKKELNLVYSYMLPLTAYQTHMTQAPTARSYTFSSHAPYRHHIIHQHLTFGANQSQPVVCEHPLNLSPEYMQSPEKLEGSASKQNQSTALDESLDSKFLQSFGSDRRVAFQLDLAAKFFGKDESASMSLFFHAVFVEQRSYLVAEPLEVKAPGREQKFQDDEEGSLVEYFQISGLPVLAAGLLQRIAENEAVLYAVCADAVIVGVLVFSAFD